MKEASERKTLRKYPGSISSKFVFIVESHVKQCWFTRRLNAIAELNISSIVQVKSSSSLVLPAISRLIKTETCVEKKVSSETTNFSDIIGDINC